MSAKQDILDKIKKKQKQIKAYKEKSARYQGPNSLVVDFIKEMELVKNNVGDNFVEFDTGLHRAASSLERKISSLDPGAHVIVHWNKEVEVNSWKELEVEAVSIEWSSFYLGKNPFNDKVTHIDIGALFLEGYLD